VFKMCGIIYYKDFRSGKTVNHQVLNQYLKQKQRGHEGFGFVGISKKNLLICRAIKEQGIKSHLRKYPLSEILFHHRMPTSTANTLKTTHPILVSRPLYQHKYYLIHNGIIHNASELKKKHEQMGITYITTQLSLHRNLWEKHKGYYEFNDSESLAHEVALFLEGKQGKIEAEGDVAFICLETDRNNNALKLHFARNHGSPLEMKKNSCCLILASQNVSHQDIPPNKFYTYDYRTQKITHHEIELPEYEYFPCYSSNSFNFFRDKFEQLEMNIQEYEEKLQRVEYAQLEASLKGDIEMFEKLELIKDRIEGQLEYLSKEWY